MKAKHIFLLLLCIYALSDAAAQVSTESKTKCMTTGFGSACGTETYSYVVSERGAKVLHGAYKFSGSDEMSTNTAELIQKCNISANFKNGKYHGPISLTTVYDGKSWNYVKGWQKWTTTDKLTGNFSEGELDGTFNIVINILSQELTYKVTATVKKNKFVGQFYAVGMSGSNIVDLKGQFDQNGKMIGTWDIGDNNNCQFINGVLVNVGTPDVQEIAKKYANGQISEAQMREKGYFIVYDSITTSIVVDYILGNVCNIKNIGGKYDMSAADYDVKYVKVIKLNTIMDDGFNLIVNEIEKKHRILCTYEQNYDRCFASYGYDEKYQSYYLGCSDDFARKYGSLIDKTYYKLYLTKEQKNKLDSLYEKYYPAEAQYFTRIFANYNEDLAKYYDLLVQDGDSIMGMSYIDERDTWRAKLMQHCNDFIDCLSKGNEEVGIVLFSKDSTYFRFEPKYGGTGEMVVKNGYPKLVECRDAFLKWNQKLADFYTEEDAFWEIDQKFKLRELLVLSYYTKRKLAANKPSRIIPEFAEAKSYLPLIDTIYVYDKKLRSTLKNEELSSYVKMFDSVTSIKPTTQETCDEFTAAIAKLRNGQFYYVTLCSKRETAKNQLATVNAQAEQLLKKSAGIKDFAKVAGNMVAGINGNLVMSTLEEADLAISQLQTLKSELDDMLEYADIRIEAEQLNAKLSAAFDANKVCGKAYKSLYKTLALKWNNKIDNFQAARQTIAVLRALDARLSSLNLQQAESNLKDAKTPEQIKTGFGI